MFTTRLMRSFTIALIALGCPVLATANEGNLAFIGATVIDGTGAAPIDNGVIVITDGRIRAVGPASDVTLPDDTRVVDVSGRTIMPGLINAHGHVGGTRGLETGYYSRDNLMRQLALYGRYGVTTIVSLGDDEEEGFALRNSQSRNNLDYARLFVAGDVISGSSVGEARNAVNRAADLGANFIKTRVDDNLGSTAKPAPEIVSAIIDQAHTRRLPVAVHLFYLEDAKAVLETGGDIIAHSIRDLPVDQEVISLIQSRDVCYIPTLTREISTFIYESEPEFFSDPFFLKEADPAVLDQLRSPERQSRMRNSASAQQYKMALEVAMQNISLLNEAGVRIAMGTDSGPPARFQGYFEHMELWMMVEAGMSPMQAIASATGIAARCMNLDGLGTLEPGNWADLMVLERNPLTDIENTRTIESVWIAGNRVPES